MNIIKLSILVGLFLPCSNGFFGSERKFNDYVKSFLDFWSYPIIEPEFVVAMNEALNYMAIKNELQISEIEQNRREFKLIHKELSELAKESGESCSINKFNTTFALLHLISGKKVLLNNVDQRRPLISDNDKVENKYQDIYKRIANQLSKKVQVCSIGIDENFQKFMNHRSTNEANELMDNLMKSTLTYKLNSKQTDEQERLYYAAMKHDHSLMKGMKDLLQKACVHLSLESGSSIGMKILGSAMMKMGSNNFSQDDARTRKMIEYVRICYKYLNWEHEYDTMDSKASKLRRILYDKMVSAVLE